MNKQPLLSVIVPVYRVEKFLKRCLDSIVNQTYKNLEIILIDDGSPDNSGKICDEYAKIDKRITVIHQLNLGLSQARNNGVAIATGEYITFVDSDDWIEKEMYEYMIETGENLNLDIIRCSVLETNGIKCKKILPTYNYCNKIIKGNEVFDLYFKEFLCKIVWNAVYKTNIVKNVLSPGRYASQDNYTSGMYLYKAKNMMILDKVFYNYWVNPDGITKSGKINKYDICICTCLLIKDLIKEGLSAKYIDMLHKKLSREIFHVIKYESNIYKITGINKNMYDYLMKNLNFRRQILLNIYIFKKNIKLY